MSLTIQSAAYANPENTAAVIGTAERGAVLVSASDTPGLWAAMLAWGTPSAYEAPTAVPQIVTRFQAKAALALAGKLSAAQAIVDASNDPMVPLAWNEVATFERQSPMLNAMAPALWPENTSAELDALFTVAAGITA